MSWEDYKEWFFKTYEKQPIGNQGCGGPVIMYGLLIAWCIFCLTGCRSTSSVETSHEIHNVSELVEKMDSLVSKTATWQQDIYQKQTSLVDSFKQKEKNDSSHSVVVNEKGDTIRERIEIHHYIEREHSSEKSESEIWMQKFHEVDSLLKISLDKQAVTDSLLKEHNKETVVEKQLSLWGKIKQSLGGGAILICSVFFILIIIKLFLYLKRKVFSQSL